MDLLSIVRTLWRFKIAALLIMIATAGGCVGVLFLVAPVYEASSSYLFVTPKPAPSDEQIAKDPTLASAKADNPYMRIPDRSVIVNVVARRVNEDSVKSKLVAKGADDRYVASPSNRFGFASPILDITATADTPETALKTVELVGSAARSQLVELQKNDVTSEYMFTIRPVETPESATQRTSGKLRALLGVLALGGVTLLVTVSSLQAWERRKRPQPVLADPGRSSAEPSTWPEAERQSSPPAANGYPQAGGQRATPPRTPAPQPGAANQGSPWPQQSSPRARSAAEQHPQWQGRPAQPGARPQGGGGRPPSGGRQPSDGGGDHFQRQSDGFPVPGRPQGQPRRQPELQPDVFPMPARPTARGHRPDTPVNGRPPNHTNGHHPGHPGEAAPWDRVIRPQDPEARS